MPYDVLIGAGRIPKSGLSNSSTELNTTLSLGSAPDPSETSASATVSRLPVRVYGLGVSVISMDTNGTTGNATNPQLKLYIDNELVASYNLPLTNDDSYGSLISEIIPLNRELWGNSSALKAVLSADTVGGNGYGCKIGLTLLGIQI